MTPSNTKKSTRTVFDLASFDDVKLEKEYPLPQKPADLREALALANNNETELVNLIYKGMVAAAGDVAYNSLEGFKVLETGELYTGQCADEETGKKIDAAILSLAKLNGYTKDLPKAEKTRIKDEVAGFLRANPAFLKSVSGASPVPVAAAETSA